MKLQNQVIVRQLGNGGAFDYDQTNTAFTLFDDTILVDCGYNIFEKLMTITDENDIKLADKIKFVFITHPHDDHVGSLMSFLYWVEFKRKSKIDVCILDDSFRAYLQSFVNCIFVYPLGQRRSNFISIYKAINLTGYDAEIYVDSLTLKSHGRFENTAYLFRKGDIVILITGDTKANANLEEFFFNIARTIDKPKGLVFHDKSNWNHPDNIHATDYDINAVYSDKFKQLIIPVHTGEAIPIKRWNYKSLKSIEVPQDET